MVAMLILALSLGLSLQAVQHAEQAADQAQEIRQADSLLNTLMTDGPAVRGPLAGVDRGFAWALDTEPTGADRPIELCRRAVQVTSQATGRMFRTASLQTCPPPGDG